MPSADVDWALAAIRDRRRQQRYELYRDYYDGRHRLMFATEKFRRVFGRVFRLDERFRELAFSDNLCATVVDVMVDRLRVSGFADPKGKETSRLATRSWETWTRNRMELRANELHREALALGDGFVIVDVDSRGQAVIWPQFAEQMAVEYDDELPGRISRAAKLWRTPAKQMRLNVYLPDRTEKYVARADRPTSAPAAKRFELIGEPLDNALGRVPVFHFPNKRLHAYGVSELRDVVPLQDALLKSQVDLLVAMEYAAFKQRWATGLQVETDEETGEPVDPDFEHGADRLWWTADPNTKFGQFEATDLKQFLEVGETWRSEIARVSGTPLHLIYIAKGDWPSGESMKSAEIRYVKKLTDRQGSWGVTWAEALAFAHALERGPAGEPKTLWETPSPRSEKELLEALTMKKNLGVSERQLLKELGYPDDQINAMLAAAAMATRPENAPAPSDA